MSPANPNSDPQVAPTSAPTSAPKIVELVFGATRVAPHPYRLPSALAIAGLAHLALAIWALSSRPSLEHWSAELAARVHTELTHVEIVEIEPPPPKPPSAPEIAPKEPPPPPQEPDDKSPPAIAESPKTSPKEQVREAPPAQAGRILGADANAPVDFSDSAFLSGQGSTYAGGVTSASSTATQAGGKGNAKNPPEPAQGPSKRPKKKGRRRDDRSQPVQMRPGEWRCPWPSAATGEPIHEEVVVLRVRINALGKLIDARLIDDPGRGFGDAALTCARAQRELFTAARTPKGTAIRAWSPPIRVRFYR